MVLSAASQEWQAIGNRQPTWSEVGVSERIDTE